MNKAQSNARTAHSQHNIYSAASNAPTTKSTISGHEPSGLNNTVEVERVPVTQGDAVYDDNGMRLDRTPTDDEINWLWDKVRTCLSKDQPGDSSGKTESNQHHVTSSQHQQYNSSQVNTKYIDGNSLAPQFRTQTRIAPSSSGSPTKKVNMDTLSTYGRRASLLNQRKLKEQSSGVAVSSHYHQQEDTSAPRSAIQTSVKPLNYQQPSSSAVPQHAFTASGYPNDGRLVFIDFI